MNLTITELYLFAVIGILTAALIYTHHKLNKAMYSGGMLTQAIKLAADGKGVFTRTPEGEIAFKHLGE
jgi:hypothetical protein